MNEECVRSVWGVGWMKKVLGKEGLFWWLCASVVGQEAPSLNYCGRELPHDGVMWWKSVVVILGKDKGEERKDGRM